MASALVVRLPWWWGLFALVALGFVFFYARLIILPLLFAAAVTIGLGYGSVQLSSRDVYHRLMGLTVQLKGKVKEDISRSSGRVSLQLHTIVIAGVAYPGTVLVTASRAGDIKRGDIAMVTGKVKGGFGSFPIVLSALAIDAIERPVPGDLGRVVRDWFADQVRKVVPEPQASLGIGFLTGQKSALPTDLSDALKIAGLTHIVVASGYNLTILVQLARKFFLRLSRYLSAVSSGTMILLFMAVTGLSPSMSRAGLVSGLSLLSWYYGHKFHPLVLLPFAAAITVACEPSYAWGDLGWQLSFGAFAAVLLVSPLLQRYFFGAKEPGLLRQVLGETIAAHAVTLPIIAVSFGTVSNVAIIANLLVVPLVPLAMLLTFMCGVWAMVHLPLAALVGMPTNWLLGYMVQVTQFVAGLSWAQTSVAVSGWVWLFYAGGLLGVCLWMWRTVRRDENASGTELYEKRRVTAGARGQPRGRGRQRRHQSSHC
ncbi:MAG TPA: ComEC/Rec2 family competence protein [Dongiaceae bacterium]|nr:ComEC/Rec2 family competence protein [Dongiaceae bacterium]